MFNVYVRAYMATCKVNLENHLSHFNSVYCAQACKIQLTYVSMLKFMSYMLAYSRYIAQIADTALNTNLT